MVTAQYYVVINLNLFSVRHTSDLIELVEIKALSKFTLLSLFVNTVQPVEWKKCHLRLNVMIK